MVLAKMTTRFQGLLLLFCCTELVLSFLFFFSQNCIYFFQIVPIWHIKFPCIQCGLIFFFHTYPNPIPYKTGFFVCLFCFVFINFSHGISMTDCWCNMMAYVCFEFEWSSDSILCVKNAFICHTIFRLMGDLPSSAKTGIFIAFLCTPKVYLQKLMCTFSS